MCARRRRRARPKWPIATGADGGGEANGSATTGAGTSSTALDDSFRGLEGTEWFSRDFSESGRRFSEVFPVRYAEVGSNGEATMVTIADLIQECACNHAQGIWGVGQSMPAEMARANLAWVCTRLHLRVRKYPKWGGEGCGEHLVRTSREDSG